MSTASAISPVQEGQRFHALDGMRASMMILGIFLHIAWFFMPGYMGHPITDTDANYGFTYFTFWVHTFRMQAFFLLAGFFACLVIQRRSFKSFMKNRLLRIVLPFVICLPPMYVLFEYQFRVGGLVSGRIQSGSSAWQLTVEALKGQDWWEAGLTHLWFLYTLIWLYAISAATYLVFSLIDRQGKVRGWFQAGVKRVLHSRFVFLWLAIPVAAAMFVEGDWIGVNAGNLIPKWPGLFVYFLYFAIGWCAYYVPDFIGRFRDQWKWKLALGTGIAAVLCAAWINLHNRGQVGFAYPLVEANHFRDFKSLRSDLVKHEDPASEAVWDSISPEYRTFIEKTEAPTADQLAGFGLELSLQVMAKDKLVAREIIDSIEQRGGKVSEEALTYLNTPEESRDAAKAMPIGRELMELSFSDAIVSPTPIPIWQKTLYFFGYGCAGWLLTFGTIGFFQHYFARASSAMRYFAEGSYWMYILHLPVQFAILVLIAPYSWGWIPKLAVYTLVSFAVLIPTYHYLVRPTWIGVILNGRRFPIRPLFASRVEEPATDVRLAEQDPEATEPSVSGPHFAAAPSNEEETSAKI